MAQEAGERAALKAELQWGAFVAVTIGIIMACVIYAAVALHINPPSNIEFIDPVKLHLSGEFTEDNLGTHVDASGQVTVRMVTTQFSFVPNCIIVPQNREIVMRFASPDVIHGLLITGTNVNTMVVPGYVSQVSTILQKAGDVLMPCHEFCGIGHSQMWATVRIVAPSDFKPDEKGRVSCHAQ